MTLSPRSRGAAYLLVAVLLAAAVTLIARGTLRSRPTGEVGRPASAFCIAAVEAHCKKRVECRGMASAQQPACERALTEECEEQVGWKLSAGVLRLDNEAAEECLEGMEQAGCNALEYLLGDDEQDMLEITTQCERHELFQPNAELGAPCSLSSDCLHGFCPVLEPGCARCRAFVKVGEPCQSGRFECDPAESYCPAADGGEPRCAPLKERGEPCGVGYECREEVCQPTASGASERTCRASRAGEPCGECESSSYCRGSGAGAVCVARVNNGDPCSAADGEDPCVDPEAHCVQGRCVVRPFTLGDGAPCRDLSDCKDGRYCKASTIGATAACATIARLKEPCALLDYGACGLEAQCVDGRCALRGSSGDGCDGPFRCKDFLNCVPASPKAGYRGKATCVAYSAIGEPCDAYRSCVTGDCAMTEGSRGVCASSTTSRSCAQLGSRR